MRAANEAFRFLLELVLLAALAYAAGTVGSAVWLQVVLAVAAPCLAAAVWGAWVAPRARRRLPDPARLAVEVALFLAGGAALAAAGQGVLGLVFAVLAIANAGLLRVGPVACERA